MWCEAVLDFIQGNIMLEIPKGYDFAESDMSDISSEGPLWFQFHFLILFLEYNLC